MAGKFVDLTGIDNVNEYYTNHYLTTIFSDVVKNKIKLYGASEDKTALKPWSRLRALARDYHKAREKYASRRLSSEALEAVDGLGRGYLAALDYPSATAEQVTIGDDISLTLVLEARDASKKPYLWVLFSAAEDMSLGVMESQIFSPTRADDSALLETTITNEELVGRIFFDQLEPPRFVLIIGLREIVLVDRNKWSEKRYLSFDMDTIFSRSDETTYQAMTVLLDHGSICPDSGESVLDELATDSARNASGVSEDLKYALRESIELLGNEVLYDLRVNKGRDLALEPVDAGELTLECLRYMYRMLFVLFIESRADLGYAPMKTSAYATGYSLESLRQIAESSAASLDEQLLEGTYVGDSLKKLFELIYTGYPTTEAGQARYMGHTSLNDTFVIPPLKAHIFDPELTAMVHAARLRNRVMLRIIRLMSITRAKDKKTRTGRISYASLGVNQMGAVYEALLSYRGFIASETLYEVKRAKKDKEEKDSFDALNVGYFVTAAELDSYAENERVRYTTGENKGKLRTYEPGSFIYRLAGRERETSASYYTPEVLTRCLVKYSLAELLKDKSASDILKLTICEPAMGSAAFLNETINQLAEAYLMKRQQELGESIPHDRRALELQKVKMLLADRNVYGIDLNPIAVELAEVSLWLNTIYEGGFVPWFGTQLVNGNSLIGARRECYTLGVLQATAKGTRWYETAPTRIPTSEQRHEKNYRRANKRIYHFLTGDPGMASYSDKVIKSLAPDNIAQIKRWNKEFIKPYSDDELNDLLELSAEIDRLWHSQVELRRTIERETRDSLSVYGYEDTTEDRHRTIRAKDAIYRKYYRSEHERNAGAYARLRFAMDYWCALWFWPIEKADMLPSRAEFIAELGFILKGVSSLGSTPELYDDSYQTNLFDHDMRREFSLFASEREEKQDEMAAKIASCFPAGGEVDLDKLCELFPRLALVKQIATQNRFMHWELEFADIFAAHGGMDLIIGNPPWIKLEWNEQSLLADTNPLFAIRDLSAADTAKYRQQELADSDTNNKYFTAYEQIEGQKNFLNAVHNYPLLKKQQTNLYKCFLPQAWKFTNETGISAFVHPEGVYDDPNGGALREEIYARLLKHFMFENERKLFHEVDHHTTFSLNVYGCPHEAIAFDSISNLFAPVTIDECYHGDPSLPVPGIKNEQNQWNLQGHPDRIIHVTKTELEVFAKIFDNGASYKGTKLPAIHCQTLLKVLERFIAQKTLSDIKDKLFTTVCWDETGAQKKGITEFTLAIPESMDTVIISGAHIGVANPYFQTTRRNYNTNRDYDNIDLTRIPDDYIIRTKYQPKCCLEDYWEGLPTAPWGRFTHHYHIMNREMVGCSSERTLTCAIAACGVAHVHTVFSLCIENCVDMACLAGCEASIPYDFLVRCIGKGHVNYNTNMLFPIFTGENHRPIVLRALLLNCLTKYYADLWHDCWADDYVLDGWARQDSRLAPERFSALTADWSHATPLRTDYERREALVELDVLTAMALGMTLAELKTIYRIQFPVLRAYEAETYYDATGRIAFTTNKGLTEVGVDRATFEGTLQHLRPGERYSHTVLDDTQRGGAVERTIEYIAPFTRADRERDYDEVWAEFTRRYAMEEN